MSLGRTIFILCTEVIRVLITVRFSTSFLKRAKSGTRLFCACLFSCAITTGCYVLFNDPVLNLLGTIAGLAAIAAAYSGTVKKKCLFVFYVLAVSCLMDLVVYAVLSATADYVLYFYYANVLSLLLLLAAQLITGKLFRGEQNVELDTRHWSFYIASLAVCIVTSLLIFLDGTISPLSLAFVCGAFLVVNLIITYLIDDLVDSSEDALENQVLRDQMRAYEREIALQNEKAEQLRAVRHDMRHHTAEIAALAQRGETAQIVRYVSALDETLDESRLRVDSGNAGLDTVLNYMLERAAERNIPVHVRVAVPKELMLSTYDMNIILGNLIENAIEAQEDADEPEIDLTIRFSVDSLFMEIGNPCPGKVRFRDGIPVTSKEPADAHGYGIKNVLRVLEKYENTIAFECAEGRFTVKILMKVL